MAPIKAVSLLALSLLVTIGQARSFQVRHAYGHGVSKRDFGLNNHKNIHALVARQDASGSASTDDGTDGVDASADAAGNAAAASATASGSGNSTDGTDDVGDDGFPAQCEQACQPFNDIVTNCGNTSADATEAQGEQCECTSAMFSSFVTCATCAPQVYAGYGGGIKGFVQGALDECKAAGFPVDGVDTSNLSGSGSTSYTGPSDNDLSSSAASASSALSSASSASSGSPSAGATTTTSPAAGSIAKSGSASSGIAAPTGGNGTAGTGASADSGDAATGIRVQGIAVAGITLLVSLALAAVW